MPTRSSLHARIALAIVLFAGFYVVAIALVVGLLYLPYELLVLAHQFNLRLIIVCVVGAGAILKGIIPRRDEFEPPGPALTREAQPRLFETIEQIATATGQAMPSEVYLAPDVNAFVAKREGLMGIDGKRVMGIGLPLLEVLTISEFRAVVAHEFGHFHGGDTRIGPWIYQTRAAIARTLQSVAEHSKWLEKPFEWYGKAFLRVTLAVSRRQEFVADEVAARVCGAPELARALVSITRAGMAYGPYWRGEVAHVVERGFRPPLVNGFAHFLSVSSVRSHLDEVIAGELANGVADAYDSHPSLKDRLSALEALPQHPGEPSATSNKAISLLSDIGAVEESLIASMLKDGVPAPSPITWAEVPHRVLVTSWIEAVRPSLPGLEGLTPAIFPEIAARLLNDADVLVRQLGVPHDARTPVEASRARAEGILGAALALAILTHAKAHAFSVSLTALPGEPVELGVQREGSAEPTIVRPFGIISLLQDKSLSTDEWLAMCEAIEVRDKDLAEGV